MSETFCVLEKSPHGSILEIKDSKSVKIQSGENSSKGNWMESHVFDVLVETTETDNRSHPFPLDLGIRKYYQ